MLYLKTKCYHNAVRICHALISDCGDEDDAVFVVDDTHRYNEMTHHDKGRSGNDDDDDSCICHHLHDDEVDKIPTSLRVRATKTKWEISIIAYQKSDFRQNKISRSDQQQQKWQWGSCWWSGKWFAITTHQGGDESWKKKNDLVGSTPSWDRRYHIRMALHSYGTYWSVKPREEVACGYHHYRNDHHHHLLFDDGNNNNPFMNLFW